MLVSRVEGAGGAPPPAVAVATAGDLLARERHGNTAACRGRRQRQAERNRPAASSPAAAARRGEPSSAHRDHRHGGRSDAAQQRRPGRRRSDGTMASQGSQPPLAAWRRAAMAAAFGRPPRCTQPVAGSSAEGCASSAASWPRAVVGVPDRVDRAGLRQIVQARCKHRRGLRSSEQVDRQLGHARHRRAGPSPPDARRAAPPACRWQARSR